MTAAPLVGIFVGGKSLRMGGRPKGLIQAPDGTGTLVRRLERHARALGAEVTLVGAHAAYDGLGLPVLADAAAESGPLAGLVALLRANRGGPVVAIACDMPFVSERLLAPLLSPTDAAVLSPRRDGRWEPLLARYAGHVLPLAERRLARGELGLQGLLDEAQAVEMRLDADAARELVDWDHEADLPRGSS